LIPFDFSQCDPNAGFETWTNTSGYNTPIGWGNLNSKTASASVYTCEKATPGYGGSGSYLQLTTKNIAGIGLVPGKAVCGVLDTGTALPVTGFAYTDRPVSLTGAWQHMASGADQGYVTVMLSKWNTGTNSRDTIAITSRRLSGMVMVWSSFSILLSYSSGSYPDSAMIILSASGTTPAAGSYLYVDSLAFTGSTPSEISNYSNSTLPMTLSPNPACHATILKYYASAEYPMNITVSDITGKVVTNFSGMAVLGQNEFNIDLKSFSKGLYFLKLVGEEGTQMQRLMVE
jgi:Secretion system C-terminal sorting domain